PESRTTGTSGISLRNRAGMIGRSAVRTRCRGVGSGIGLSRSPIYESFIVNTPLAGYRKQRIAGAFAPVCRGSNYYEAPVPVHADPVDPARLASGPAHSCRVADRSASQGRLVVHQRSTS